MTGRSGFTLVEIVSSLTVLAIIAMIATNVVMESTRIYARTVPAMDASYKAELTTNTLMRDLRDLTDLGAISEFTATEFTFEDSNGSEIAYLYSGTDLTRNGDLLAEGVTAFRFDFYEQDGSPAGDEDDLHLIAVDFTVQTGDQVQRRRTVAFPRFLGLP